MRIYFSGLGGVGIGPLAKIAHDAGYDVVGSDLQPSPMTIELEKSGVQTLIGQDGSQIASSHAEKPIEWFVYTSALPNNHPELTFARQNNIRTSKRDEFLAEFIQDKNLKLIAVAGTHGKTTTTGLLVWAMKQLGIPVSYSIGTNISFGPSGSYDSQSEYFVYECDEYDRNMLHFEPHLSLIMSVDYDHPDTYPTIDDYQAAFTQFIEQSQYSIIWEKDLRSLARSDITADYEAYDELMNLQHITLAGDHVRHNAYLVERGLRRLLGESANIVEAINSFPGTTRRFEKLSENLYSDYGHHPTEIAATLQLASELSNYVVLVYQPHQNVRQHKIRDAYTDCMDQAKEIYWLPTYLSREDSSLEILSPQQLSTNLTYRNNVHIADLNDELWSVIMHHQNQGHLVLCMGAGSIDEWLRKQLLLT